MKIAIVYDSMHLFARGGVEKRIYLLGRELAKKGHEIHLFCPKYWNGSSIKKFGKIILHGVCNPMKSFNSNGKRTVLPPLVFSIFLIPKLFVEKFDVVDCQNFPFFTVFSCKLYCFVEKKPLIVTCHEFWGNYWNEYIGFFGFFGKFVEKISLESADKIIAVSRHTMKRIETANVRVKKIGLVQAGIPVPEKTFSKKEIDLLYAGRLTCEKNIELLLETVSVLKKRFSKIKCLIAGEGPQKGKLAEFAKFLNLEKNIEFVDFVPEKELHELFRKAKIFIMPSKREGFSLASIEAMSCGLPVITIDAEMNAAKDLVKSGFNGFCCSETPEALAKAISILLPDEALLKKMSGNAMAFSKNFTIQKFAADYENALIDFARLKIGFEEFFDSSEKTGVANYALNLAKELKQDNRIELIEFRAASHPLGKIFLKKNPVNGLLRKAAYAFKLNALLPLQLLSKKCDVFIAPNFVRPIFLPCKSIVVFHDANMFAMPQYFDQNSNLFFREMISYSAKRANAVIVPSNFTKSEIAKHLGIDLKKIFVTPEAAAGIFFEKISKKRIAEFMKQNSLNENFVLFVGTVHKRKNLENIFIALKILADSGERIQLAVAGNDGFGAMEIRQKAKDLGLEKQVKFFGYVPEQKLPLFYNSSRALIYASHYEGFGLPILEAMACGTPVITSNKGAMAETAENAALLVNPEKPQEIANAIKKILKSNEFAKELSAKGIARASQFSWKKTSMKTIEMALKVSGNGN